MSTVLRLENVSKVFTSGSRQLTVLDQINFEIAGGTSTAIVGPSGSGKTTLLGLCAGLDNASGGNLVLGNQNLNGMSEDQRAEIRNQMVGFVFQNFQLMPTLTALENVMVPLELRGARGIRDDAAFLLDKVGLGERLDHYPIQLSGGEQQRVALARAFINKPAILFADEPTGNLDAETSEKITDLLFEMNSEANTTLVLVTHNMELAQMTDRIIRLSGGRIVEDLAVGFEALSS